MRFRRTREAQQAARALIQEHSLNSVGTPLVISSWVNPVPMVLHCSSKFTEFGDVTLALLLLLLARILPLGILGDVFVAFASSFSLAWFLFRFYYDVRYFEGVERMILLPPNSNDNTLLHELLHIEQGHIRQMPLWHRLLALSPLGPLEYGVRTARHDYGGEGVVGELHRRVKSSKVPKFAIPGFLTFGYCVFVFFLAIILTVF